MDVIAASVSVPIWIYVGKIFAENIPALEKAIKSLQIGSILLVLFGILLIIGAHFLKKRFLQNIENRKNKKHS
jgi:membrane protein DedA with SNARE-associated domain